MLTPGQAAAYEAYWDVCDALEERGIGVTEDISTFARCIATQIGDITEAFAEPFPEPPPID